MVKQENLACIESKMAQVQEFLPEMVSSFVRLLRAISALASDKIHYTEETYFTEIFHLFMSVKISSLSEEKREVFNAINHEMFRVASSFWDMDMNEINELNQWLNSLSAENNLEEYLIKKLNILKKQDETTLFILLKFRAFQAACFSFGNNEEFSLTPNHYISDSVIEDAIIEYYTKKGYEADSNNLISGVRFKHTEHNDVFVSVTNWSDGNGGNILVSVM